MLEDFSGLKIKGRCFTNETTLNFFEKKNRVSLIFGRNGSGKSTVSKAFSCIASGQTLDGVETIEILDHNSTTGASSKITPTLLAPKIAVFNEAYVREKISIKEDQKGLGAIVLFGEQAEIDEKIKNLHAKRTEVESKIAAASELNARYADANDPISPDAIYNRIISTLQNKKTRSGWAYRHAAIFGQVRAPTADKNLIRCILNYNGEDDPDIRLDKLTDKIKELQALEKLVNSLTIAPINIGSMLDLDEAALVNLLNRRIQQPNPTERDKKIAEVIAKRGTAWVEGLTRHLDDASTDHCPCCLRPMTAESKDEILESIKAALSKDVEEYQTTLSEFQLPAIPNIDLSDYSRIDPEHVREYGKLTGELNTIINHYQDDLIKKQDGIFSTDHYISRGYAAVKAKIDTCLNNLEHSRQSFEEKKAHLEDLRKSIEEINCKLAKQEIQVDSAACITQHKLKKDNADSLANLIKDRNKLTAEINQRESEKKNVKIAAERINSALAYIFMSDKRIRLVPSDGVYTIEVNGHTVLPSDVSIGERNALALCYFFSDMFSGSAANTTYQSERLVVLDDPVSSFDQENKMGVLSYLMFEIENLTCTSTTISGKTIRPETRIICMMHELYAFLALATSINSHDKSAPVKIAQHLDALDFRETKLKELDQRVDNINEYRRNFDEIFAYASEATPGPNLHVGNQARRMLEAFSTFVFREGLEHLFFANVIQGEHADAYNNYYRGIFSRYVVNDESHLQGRVRSLTNANSLLPFLNDTERQRAVRDSICLLYLIMPQHVRSLIVDKKDPSAIATRESCIKGWLKNIRENSPRIGGDPT